MIGRSRFEINRLEKIMVEFCDMIVKVVCNKADGKRYPVFRANNQVSPSENSEERHTDRIEREKAPLTPSGWDGCLQFGRRTLPFNMSDGEDFPAVIELNVGGVPYTTTLETLNSQPDSQLNAIFTGREPIQKDAKNRYFIDRDGVLFRYVLDFLRDGNIILPECFRERERLMKEAEKLRLHCMVEAIYRDTRSRPPGVITVGYRGSFQFGKDGLADVKFRKLSR